ncbi:hypothetical protein KIPB_004038, partial [Kipferlia bialata]|eukprot:g1336.t1
MRGRKAADGILLTRFKLLLDGALTNSALTPMDTDALRCREIIKVQPPTPFERLGLGVVDVVADYLRFMYMDVMRVITTKYGTSVGMDAVQWCLTVPAM